MITHCPHEWRLYPLEEEDEYYYCIHCLAEGKISFKTGKRILKISEVENEYR